MDTTSAAQDWNTIVPSGTLNERSLHVHYLYFPFPHCQPWPEGGTIDVWSQVWSAYLNTRHTDAIERHRKGCKSCNGHGRAAGLSFSDFVGSLAQAAESSKHSFPVSPNRTSLQSSLSAVFQPKLSTDPVVNHNLLTNRIMAESVLTHECPQKTMSSILSLHSPRNHQLLVCFFVLIQTFWVSVMGADRVFRPRATSCPGNTDGKHTARKRGRQRRREKPEKKDRTYKGVRKQ